MNASPWLPVVIIGCITLVAAVIDVRTRRIPNWFTVPVLAGGLIFHTVTGGWGGLLTALGGFVTGFGILLVLWLMGGGGGGDVKLMGAVGAWLGAWLTLIVFLLSAGFAAFFSLVVLLGGLMRHGYRHIQRRHLGQARRDLEKEKSRFGIARNGPPQDQPPHPPLRAARRLQYLGRLSVGAEQGGFLRARETHGLYRQPVPSTDVAKSTRAPVAADVSRRYAERSAPFGRHQARGRKQLNTVRETNVVFRSAKERPFAERKATLWQLFLDGCLPAGRPFQARPDRIGRLPRAFA